MKTCYFALAALVLNACKAENKSCEATVPETGKNTIIYTYDSQEAERIGADEYGMKDYVIAFLKKGSNPNLNSVSRESVMRAHLDNIQKLEASGKLSVAGPFTDEGEISGIYIFNVETMAEAEALAKTDPAVAAGLFVMELHPWYGSAAVSEISERHKIYAQKKI